ncbi:hypothetical protein ATE92_0879 [Ulvibacter sp. MAR_2010_11]|uniref:hypothetical protein n=1 Tax=Ulvibacter sp. MAR_2010_11 TaxID=1250229 RepID=UPI000C2C27CB|nr:hypothetical protein [Ulvibacter sp. MAR_2010_11]PKA82742.1 hypothetical protein ATE92_0879 [Ulvibacter sp. MAR_2010_11]
MTFFKTSVAIVSLAIFSYCSSTKTNTNDSTLSNTPSASELSKESQKMLDAGFKRATIVASAVEGDCPYTLQMVEDNNALLDPINLEETYKSNGMKVWVIYNGLRMMNRCEKANPVSIQDIRKRAE